MILFVEPISKNTGMYVPAYPLSILEIASFVKTHLPKVEIRVVSMPMDYGLPMTGAAKDRIHQNFLLDISELNPNAIGISCTAISQAEETLDLCNIIKKHHPDIFIFLGGYFPTIYYEDIFARTAAVDLIVLGEGELATLKIVELLDSGKNPINDTIPNLAWKKNGKICLTKKAKPFDLGKKSLLDLDLLRHPPAYDILPYAFSRGCPHRCNFCMEEFIRPIRRKVPQDIVQKDLKNLSEKSKARMLLVGDALFTSFDLFPFLRSLQMKVSFETRCDVLNPDLLSEIADVCGVLALGLESASYSTLRRMNKVRDRSHYEKYISGAKAIFKEAVRNEIPLLIFMISGYPGDTEEDLKQSLSFARDLSNNKGAGGHIFKIGECHVYPKTKIHDLAVSLPDVVFDDDGVFGQNIVRQPSQNLGFATVLAYAREIFDLSNHTPKLQNTFREIMPFFRLPVQALQDEVIPDHCFRESQRQIFSVQREQLSIFRELVPELAVKYKKLMSGQRSTRMLPL